MHRNTGDTESIIVEYGFLDSKGDDVSQIKNNWRAYAEAVVQAVLKYIGYDTPNTGNYPTENIYVVQPGDTLYSLSKRFNIPVSTIKEINNLTTDLLRIGQELFLPYSPMEGNTYVVKAGDTLYSIAKKYGLSVDELKRINGLNNNILSIGQILLINPSTTEEPPMVSTYIVQSGDTLYSIAKRFDTTVNALKEMNGLTSNLLSIGQQLIVA